MLLGIGIDILSIARLDAVLQRRGAARVAQRICSARELRDFAALAPGGEELQAKQLRFLCARWAVKEAAFKALPPRTLSGWKDLELGYAASGRPDLRLVWESRQMLAARAGARRATGHARTRVAPGLPPAGEDNGNSASDAWAANTTDINTDDVDAERHAPAEGILLLPSVSHDAGVLVAVVVAQRG